MLFPPGKINGNKDGRPNSDGFFGEIDYLPWERWKFFAQYTLYHRFNGGISEYDGADRDASDNNTFYFVIWLML